MRLLMTATKKKLRECVCVHDDDDGTLYNDDDAVFFFFLLLIVYYTGVYRYLIRCGGCTLSCNHHHHPWLLRLLLPPYPPTYLPTSHIHAYIAYITYIIYFRSYIPHHQTNTPYQFLRGHFVSGQDEATWKMSEAQYHR